jgi:hypothetical protein
MPRPLAALACSLLVALAAPCAASEDDPASAREAIRLDLLDRFGRAPTVHGAYALVVAGEEKAQVELFSDGERWGIRLVRAEGELLLAATRDGSRARGPGGVCVLGPALAEANRSAAEYRSAFRSIEAITGRKLPAYFSGFAQTLSVLVASDAETDHVSLTVHIQLNEGTPTPKWLEEGTWSRFAEVRRDGGWVTASAGADTYTFDRSGVLERASGTTIGKRAWTFSRRDPAWSPERWRQEVASVMGAEVAPDPDGRPLTGEQFALIAAIGRAIGHLESEHDATVAGVFVSIAYPASEWRSRLGSMWAKTEPGLQDALDAPDNRRDGKRILGEQELRQVFADRLLDEVMRRLAAVLDSVFAGVNPGGAVVARLPGFRDAFLRALRSHLAALVDEVTRS